MNRFRAYKNREIEKLIVANLIVIFFLKPINMYKTFN